MSASAGYADDIMENNIMSILESDLEEKRAEVEREFMDRTLDITEYDLIDVLADDACLFRALSLGIFVNLESVKFGETIREEFRHPETKFELGYLHVDDETRIARTLQELAKNWIIDNKDKKLECCGMETVEDVVKNTHYLDNLDEYEQLYSIFAGKPNLQRNRFGQYVKIAPRWGGFPEEIALSDIFCVDISIYVPRKIGVDSDEIVASHDLGVGTRFEIYAEVKFNGNREGIDIPFIQLLCIDHDKAPHYQFMQKKD